MRKRLCSRVAVVAGGRLAAAGRLNEILAFEIRGWELVMTGVTPEVLARLTSTARRTTEIFAGQLRDRAGGRDGRRSASLADLVATGAKLVSLNPVRDTLEDFFVKRVAEAGSARPASLEASRARH